MSIFGRKRTQGSQCPLLAGDAITRLASYGKAHYDGTVDVFDMWPGNFVYEFSQLPAERQRSCLEALIERTVPDEGWAIYGAEDLLGGDLGRPGTDPLRDALFEAYLQFQRSGGVWWNALSPQEHIFWEQRHPDEEWLHPKGAPSRETAQITPLPVGEERRLTMLSRAADAKGMYVVHREPGAYVLQLGYSDDEGNQLRDDRDQADDLYDLFMRFGRGMPFPGVWADPELEQFMLYPAPRL